MARFTRQTGRLQRHSGDVGGLSAKSGRLARKRSDTSKHPACIIKYRRLPVIFTSMTRENTKGGVVVAMHLLAWALLGFVLVFYQPLSWGVSLPAVFWVKQFLNFGLLVALFYFNSHYLVPRYLLKNRIFVFILWVIALVVLMLMVSKLADQQLEIRRHMERIMPRPRHRGGPKPRHLIDGILLMTTLLIMGVSTSMAVIQRWQADARLHDAVEKQNITSELALLKAQINPHFFFNTLNTIYGLIVQNQEVAQDAVHRLSKLMRYHLYDSNERYVPLRKEIEFMIHYIDLMKLRITPNVSVQYKFQEVKHDIMVAPLLFIPLIENSFKHGVHLNKPSEIVMTLEVIHQKQIVFYIRNTSFPKKENDQSGSGIGLENLKKRLNLLYPERYTFVAEESGAYFDCTLTIHV